MIKHGINYEITRNEIKLLNIGRFRILVSRKLIRIHLPKGVEVYSNEFEVIGEEDEVIAVLSNFGINVILQTSTFYPDYLSQIALLTILIFAILIPSAERNESTTHDPVNLPSSYYVALTEGLERAVWQTRFASLLREKLKMKPFRNIRPHEYLTAQDPSPIINEVKQKLIEDKVSDGLITKFNNKFISCSFWQWSRQY